MPSVSPLLLSLSGYESYLVLHDPLHQHQAPQHDQRLYRIGERMCLVGPSDIGGSNQDHRNPSLSWRVDQLMDCPIFEHEAQDEHHASQCVINDLGRNLLFACFCPQPP